ncbi:DEDD exonuclease domain-containing protein [Rubrobacter radiotolerans]|uniref:DEDD exonuclease domain-containing protein n=1 Tax=Rubrobacter radiotolerans TaxID=42256 RepID=A0AB35T873_RUBRA|nr:DEDD exonuclease domain-containing protein [Rubrobacter radiotolerans]MDX5892950.1 DEDD exonuclease domain-containing protein [Rubrobacter radiotolerans]
MSPEEVASGFLSMPDLNGDARSRVELLTEGDPRFVWDEGLLRTADLGGCALREVPFVVFDLETTGSSAKEGRITEFGAVKLVGGEVREKFTTLVNPERHIDPFVTRLTGITDEMVAGAPKVGEVLPLFEEFVEGTVLVAHNARFDCAFVEAARGASLPNPVLDTLKLARMLVPGLRRYRLSSLATHLGVRQVPNHRAFADASVTAEVFVKLLSLLQKVGVGTVGEALALKGSKLAKIKPQKQHLAKDLPQTPGVYYFLDKDGVVLYVGKAKNLRSRVRTYFNGGDGRRKIGRLVEQVAEVSVRETGTELRALILEAKEIRRLLPRFNSAGRSDRPGWFLKLDTAQEYPVPERVPESEAEKEAVLIGPYRSARSVDACTEALGRIFPIRRCDGAPGGPDGPCFYGQLGRCGPCNGMSPEEYEREVVGGISALLRGEGGEEHLAALVAERSRLARALEFEAAARLRDLIAGIERVRFTRTLVKSEGLQAIVAPSTEPEVFEVFVLSGGRLVAHESFSRTDAGAVREFAASALKLARRPLAEGQGAGEARVVAAYLRRRAPFFEAAPLAVAGDLVSLVGRAVERSGEEEADAGAGKGE